MRTTSIFILLSTLFMLPGCNTKTAVDLILKNGTIYTVDSTFSVAQSVAIVDGEFIAVGTDEEILSKYQSNEIIDLRGMFVYPGFIDPHCHFYGYGLTLAQVDLCGTTSYADVVKRAQEHHKTFGTYWITGRGWDQNNWEGQEFPTKELLDEAFPDNPVLLRRIDGHAAIANSLALKKAEISAATKIEGGKVILEKGKVAGLLIDKAVDKVLAIVPDPTVDEETQALLKAQDNCFAVGLTSVGDAGLNKSTIALMDKLQQEGKLQMNIYAMLEPTPENLDHFLKKGPYKTDKLHVQSVKLYADGALGSRGACLLEPYADDPANYGLLVETPEYLKSICQMAYENNFQVNTHCIGDSANRLMLNIYGSILKGKNDKRWRIEHAQVVNNEDVKLFGEFNIIPSMQTTHCTSDMYWADERLGERITDAYVWQDLLKQNGWFPNGSDFPIEDINPLYGFYAAVTRQDQKQWPENGFYPDQKLSRKEALQAMTIWAAKAQFEENEKGSIEPGKKADFVILGNDLLNEESSELFQMKVLHTFVKGEKVY